MFYLVQLFADWLTYTIFRIAPKTLLGEAVSFFVYDTIKIFLLLIVIIFSSRSSARFFRPRRYERFCRTRKIFRQCAGRTARNCHAFLHLQRYSIILGISGSRRAARNDFFFFGSISDDQ